MDKNGIFANNSGKASFIAGEVCVIMTPKPYYAAAQVFAFTEKDRGDRLDPA